MTASPYDSLHVVSYELTEPGGGRGGGGAWLVNARTPSEAKMVVRRHYSDQSDQPVRVWMSTQTLRQYVSSVTGYVMAQTTDDVINDELGDKIKIPALGGMESMWAGT